MFWDCSVLFQVFLVCDSLLHFSGSVKYALVHLCLFVEVHFDVECSHGVVGRPCCSL